MVSGSRLKRLLEEGPYNFLSGALKDRKWSMQLVLYRRRMEKYRDNEVFENELDPSLSFPVERRFWRKKSGSTGEELLRNIEDRQSFFPFPASERDEVAKRWRKEMPLSSIACIEEADRIIDGDLRAIAPSCPRFESVPDWLRGFSSGELWPLVFCNDHPDLDGGDSLPDDARSLWEISRLQYFSILGGAYLATEDEKYAVAFKQHFESFRKQNPLCYGLHWLHAQETALRAVSLCWAWPMFYGSESLDDTFRLALLETIAISADIVFRNLSDTPKTHNHLITELCSLVFISSVFPEFIGSLRWRRRSLKLALRELERQIGDDGFHRELSTGYHLFVFESYLQLYALLRASGEKIPPLFKRKMEAMLYASIATQRGEGGFWRVGDVDDGRAFRVPGPAQCSRSGSLEACSIILGLNEKGDLERKEGFAESFWLTLSLPSRNPRKGLTDFHPIERFEDAGFVSVMDENCRLFFRAGAAKRSLNVPPNHQHADFLSFCFSLGEDIVFDDPGVYLYGPSLPLRFSARRTTSHNSPCLDGRDIFEVDRYRFGVAQPPCSQILASGMQKGFFFISAEHEGYYPARIRRDIFLHPGRFLFIVDCMKPGDDREHLLSASYLTELDIRPEQSLWRLSGGKQNIVMQKLSGASAKDRVLESSGTDDETWISPRYGERRPARRLMLCAEGRGTLYIAALVSFGSEEEEKAQFILCTNGYHAKIGDSIIKAVDGKFEVDLD